MAWQNIVSASIATAISLAWALPAAAQVGPRLVQLGPASAAVHMPAAGPAPHVAFLVSHRVANVLNNNACRELAQRGFMALCFNTRFVNNEPAVKWEEIGLDVKAAVEFVRSQPGITKVILFGHSGGSPMMTLYEGVAENGTGFCKGANKLTQCGEELAGVKPADALVLADAHPGNGVNVIRNINPAISLVNNKVVVDPSLDPFDPKNGFNPKGNSKYSAEFRDRYYRAQSRKMNELITEAQKIQASMKAGTHRFPDNDVFLVPFSEQEGSALLGALDPSTPETMMTASPRKLLKNDGTIVTQIVKAVSVGQYDHARTNLTFEDGNRLLSVQAFLSANAVKSTHAITGVDHCSSNNSTTCGVRSIKIPTLVAAMGAYNFIRDQEIMFETSAATDKDYIVIEGALHGYNGCRPCETTPGQYANATKNLFDYVAKWTNERF